MNFFAYFIHEEVGASPLLLLRLLRIYLVCQHPGSPDTVVDRPYKGYCRPNIYVVASTGEGLFPRRRRAGLAMHLSIASASMSRRPSTETMKGGGVSAFLETMLQLLIILPFLFPTKKLLWQLVPIGDVVSVHDKHVMNTVHPSLSEFADQQIYLLL